MPRPNPVSVIVNADDLGISPEVNDAIFALMADGKVTSATLLANAPYVEAACRQLKAFPLRSFGVHLNLTEFSPLTGSKLLIDPATGSMSRKIEKARASRALVQAVEAEFSAQIERLLDLGVSLTHIDSHHHVHTVPFVFPALKAVQRRYRIRRARLSKNLYTPEDRPSRKQLLLKYAYNHALRHIYCTETTVAFTELSSYASLVRDHLPRPRTVELMTHPGAARYEKETALLESGWAPDPGAFRLICYRAL